MRLRHLSSRDYLRTPWRNDAGWTREIASESTPEGALIWRASVAEITADSPYSAWPGVVRDHILLSGDGLELRFADDRTHSLHPPHDRLRFDGADAPECTLIDGPATAFNFMHDPIALDADVLHRPLTGTLALFAETTDMWLIYLIAGWLRSAEVTLDQGDSLIVDQVAASNRRLLLEGAGEALLIKLTPTSAA